MNMDVNSKRMSSFDLARSIFCFYNDFRTVRAVPGLRIPR